MDAIEELIFPMNYFFEVHLLNDSSIKTHEQFLEVTQLVPVVVGKDQVMGIILNVQLTLVPVSLATENMV